MEDTDKAFDRRRAGVLLHVTSLPSAGPSGSQGAGDLGDEAYRFVDFLAAAGCSVWQVLPLAPTHPGDGSPYNALSAMAGNAAMISRAHQAAHHLEAPQALGERDRAAFSAWCAAQADWLEPYVEFMALRELHDNAPWPTWAPALRERDPHAVADALSRLAETAESLRFEQWVFAVQWARLRQYAASQGVLLFGDLPIFVSLDSADVWASRELFDLVRIDHFRAFEAAWHVPVEAATAREGRWVPAPGTEILTALVDTAGPGSLVAEDLGVNTPEVDELRLRFGLPGMKVLQFAFDGDPDNLHLPHHHGEHNVVYTGTHDNDTTVGWWESLDEDSRHRVRSVLSDPGEAMPWALVRLAMESTARLSVVPAQDVLGLGSESRMNIPGTGLGNWTWQAPAGAFDSQLATRIRELVAATDRLA
jgi:4-alpha-glucanotransferase